MIKNFEFYFIFFLGQLIFTCPTYSDETITYQLVHQKAAPVLDGKLDDQVWKNATVIEAKYEDVPLEGGPAIVPTVAYLYEDGSNLYVGIYNYDPEPEKIRAHLVDRDSAWDDDLSGLTIDTFNDERGGFEFYLNPLGVQTDVRMKDDNGWQGDSSWNAIWYGAASIVDDGWTVEYRIPFESLRFPKTDGEQTWGIGIFRSYPRDVVHWLTDYKKDPERKCILCQFSKIRGFDSVKPGKNLIVAPTVTFSNHQDRDPPASWQDKQENFEPSLDIRWGFTENSVVNATINPDFSQVEADAAQLEVNTTYSLFLAERRPFFLDGKDYFNTSLFNFVHTRNIAAPDMGIKLTGKNEAHSYGLLLADDKSTSFLIPGNQESQLAEFKLDDRPQESEIAIARYKMDVSGRSNLGALVTHRQGADYQNTVVGLDSDIWFGNNVLRVQVANSKSLNPLAIQSEYELESTQNDNALAIEYVRNTRDYELSASHTNVGTNFRADLGFIVESDYKKNTFGAVYKRYGDENALFTNHYYTYSYSEFSAQNGQALIDEHQISTTLDGKLQSHSEINLSSKQRYYSNEFLPQGEYFDEEQVHLYFRFIPKAGLKFVMETKLGDQVDFENAQLADLKYVNAQAIINLGQHLGVNLSYRVSTLDAKQTSYEFGNNSMLFPSGRLFTAKQSDLRLQYQFNVQSQIKLVFQYTDIDRNTELYRHNFDDNPDNDLDRIEKYFSSQLIYSYKLNPQSLFYIGYSDGGYQDDTLPRAERDSRTLFAKISYAFQK